MPRPQTIRKLLRTMRWLNQETLYIRLIGAVPRFSDLTRAREWANYACEVCPEAPDLFLRNLPRRRKCSPPWPLRELLVIWLARVETRRRSQHQLKR